MKIFLLGFMGAGKSYWGRGLAAALQLPFYDLDAVIVAEEGKTVAEIFAEKGEDYFRRKEQDTLHKLSVEQDFIISCGGGTPCFFDNMDFMNRNGITVWLNPSVETIVSRLKKKKYKRPLIAHLDDEELTAFVEKKLAERAIYYRQARLTVDAGNTDISNLAEILKDADE